MGIILSKCFFTKKRKISNNKIKLKNITNISSKIDIGYGKNDLMYLYFRPLNKYYYLINTSIINNKILFYFSSNMILNIDETPYAFNFMLEHNREILDFGIIRN